MDYKDFTPAGPSSDGLNVVQKRWWNLKGEQQAQALGAVLKLIYENDTRRQTQYQTSARLYGNITLMGVTGFSFTRGTQQTTSMKDRLSYNVVQSSIDTVTAKIAKNKPRPMFLTSGGDWEQQRKAKRLNKFIEGIFYENKAYDLGPDVFRDAAVLGNGIIHVFEHFGRIKYERVYPGEIYIDYADGRYSKPRSLHRVKAVDRDVLLELFPNKRKEILIANAATFDPARKFTNVSDQVNIGESWHLKSGPDAKDGKHVIWIEGSVLLSEDYEKDHFPFANLPWSKRQDGPWAQSATEQIQGIQLEVNKLLWVIQRSYQLAGSFKVLLENGSKIVKEHLNNDVGAIVAYTGTPPQYITVPPIAMEAYQWLEKLKASAYEQLGVSMLSASSKKPEGLDSGKALREYNDIESDRFMLMGERYEELFLDLARTTIDLARDIYEREGEYSVKVPGKKFIETIDWKEIDLDDDQFVMKAFPVSSLPQTPQGKLQTVQEYMQAGLISPRTGRKLLDFPDLQSVEDVQNAPEEYLQEVIEKIVYDKQFTAPEPYDDLDLALELANEYYAMSKSNNVPEENLSLLRKFIDQVNMLKDKAAMAMAPQPGAGMPQAIPEAPPQSDMIPNIPQGMPA